MKKVTIDHFVLGILLLVFLVNLAQGAAGGSMTVALTWGVPVILLSLVLFSFRETGVFGYWSAVATQAMVALQIHESMGSMEMHFGVFVALALCTGYRKPTVVLTGFVAVAAHHVIFNYLQSIDSGVYIFASGASWSMVLLHAAYAVVEAGVLGFFAYAMQREARVGEALVDSTNSILSDPKIIDLTVTIAAVDHEVVRDFQTLVKRLAEAIGQAQRVGENIAASLPELRAGADKALGQGRAQRRESEQAAAATEQMAAAVSQVSASIQQVAQLTDDAWNQNANAQTSVQATGQAIEELAVLLEGSAREVDELARQSSAISSAVSVIDNIADQTNLLALNAAIEAARAGEQGRGFAVVADEVRKLARRTQESTRQIGETVGALVSTSKKSSAAMAECIARVGATVARGQESRQATEAIHRGLDQVRTEILQIASAMEQQASVGSEVARNAAHIQLLNQDMSELTEGNRDQLNANATRINQLVEGLSTVRCQPGAENDRRPR